MKALFDDTVSSNLLTSISLVAKKLFEFETLNIYYVLIYINKENFFSLKEVHKLIFSTYFYQTKPTLPYG